MPEWIIIEMEKFTYRIEKKIQLNWKGYIPIGNVI